MTKEHFVEVHGEPIYTVGVGGSGGGIQQYVYGQNHPDLLDGGVPQYSYPDMVTQTIHVGDCELLEHYFDKTDSDNPTVARRRGAGEGRGPQRRATSPQREQRRGRPVEPHLRLALPVDRGHAAVDPGGRADPGLTECRSAWYGLTPLVLNPTFTDVDDLDKLAEGAEGVEWTHAGDAVNVYGTDPQTGFARNPWDNVGVQYGLDARRRRRDHRRGVPRPQRPGGLVEGTGGRWSRRAVPSSRRSAATWPSATPGRRGR